MKIRAKAANADCGGIFQKSLIISETKRTTIKNKQKLLETKKKLAGISKIK